MNGAPPTKHQVVEAMRQIVLTVDAHAQEMNRRWGYNRLPHIVPIEWTERFVEQKRRWQLACFECCGSPLQADLDRVRTQGDAMLRAYAKLEELALAGGMAPAQPGVWEFELSNGQPVMLVRTDAEVAQVDRPAHVRVWTLEEVARIIERWPELVLAKQLFPEAQVIQVRTSQKVRDLIDDELAEIPF